MAIREILVKKDCFICGGKKLGCYDCGGEGYEIEWVPFAELVKQLKEEIEKQK